MLPSGSGFGAEGTPDTSAPVVPAIPFLPRYDLLINHAYKPSGRMNNHVANPNVTITGTLTLLERPYGSTDTVEVETAGFTIGPSGQSDFLFGPITKNWTWLISGIWVRNFSEPLSKSFVYSVRFAFTDSYGNAYSSKESPRTLLIEVSVSDEKRGYADGALGVLAVGLIAAIFTFGAGLSAAQAIAGGLGSKALDPPTPDSRFRSRVVVQESPLPRTVRDERFATVMTLLTAAERAFTLIQALGDIQNRMLGARENGDRTAIELQRTTYQETERALLQTVESLIRLRTEAVEAVQRVPEFNRDVLEGTLREWQRRGIPRDTRQRLVEDGCTDQTLAELALAVQEPALIEIAHDLPQCLNLMTHSVALATRELHKRTRDVLADPRREGSHATRVT